MAYGFLFAILSPLFYALVNVYDKYVVEHMAKQYLGYVVIEGTTIFMFSMIWAALLDWRGISYQDMIFPLASGVMWGLVTWLYYLVLSKEDVSHIVGLNYLYPIIVAILSYAILGEKLHIWSYLGIALTIIGAAALSGRLRLAHKNIIAYTALMISLAGIAEFSVKIVTEYIPVWHGLVLSLIATGLTMMSVCFNKRMRRYASSEVHNFHIAGIGVGIYFVSMGTLYLAMDNLGASIVSSIATTQPMFVVLFEAFVDRFHAGISLDKEILPKLGAITVIVSGVVLIYLTELY